MSKYSVESSALMRVTGAMKKDGTFHATRVVWTKLAGQFIQADRGPRLLLAKQTSLGKGKASVNLLVSGPRSMSLHTTKTGPLPPFGSTPLSPAAVPRTVAFLPSSLACFYFCGNANCDWQQRARYHVLGTLGSVLFFSGPQLRSTSTGANGRSGRGRGRGRGRVGGGADVMIMCLNYEQSTGKWEPLATVLTVTCTQIDPDGTPH